MRARILVVDDEAEIRRSVRMILEYDGYDVLEASSGPEGVALAEKESPDLVFLDVKMPGMDGLEALQRALNLAVSKGAMIQDVSPGSPAERAGLHPYDVIVQVEGRQVINNEEVIRDISARQPGSVAKLDFIRDGRHQSTQVKLAERPPRERSPDGLEDLGPRPRPRQPEPTETPLGLTVRDLDRSLVGRLEIPDSVSGVMIARVDPTGAGFQALLRRGFVIMEINKRPVANVADYQRIVSAARPGDILALYVYDPTLSQRSLVTVTVE